MTPYESGQSSVDSTNCGNPRRDAASIGGHVGARIGGVTTTTESGNPDAPAVGQQDVATQRWPSLCGFRAAPEVAHARVCAAAGAPPSLLYFAVPGQPQGKGRPRIGKVGQHARMFTPKKTVAYEGLIALAAQQAMGDSPILEGPLCCEMFIDCQVPESWSRKKREAALAGTVMPATKPDTDNVVKAVFDGCNGVAFKDDVQVVDLRVRKRYAATPGLRVAFAVVRPEGGLL